MKTKKKKEKRTRVTYLPLAFVSFFVQKFFFFCSFDGWNSLEETEKFCLAFFVINQLLPLKR